MMKIGPKFIQLGDIFKFRSHVSDKSDKKRTVVGSLCARYLDKHLAAFYQLKRIKVKPQDRPLKILANNSIVNVNAGIRYSMSRKMFIIFIKHKRTNSL